MLSVATVAIAAAALVAPSSTPNGGDDNGIRVHGGSGWVTTGVTDAGVLAGRPHRDTPVPPVRCTQMKSDNAGGYATQAQFKSGAPPTDGLGGWVVRRCSDGSVGIAWVPLLPDAAEVAELARRATNRLLLPLPAPKFNPSRPSSAGPATLVAIPTWFWVDGWRPISQRTQAGGVWAEVVATPVSATWDPGDGTVVRCTGPGTAWRPGAMDSRCEHVYVRSSAGQPRNVYTANVVVTWRVTWTGSGGRSGSLPLMERQTTFPIAVAERQTVVTTGGMR